MSNAVNKPGPMHVVILGLAQILVWGGSFFLLSILADPIVKDTGWSQQWVLGSLSIGILVSGLLSPQVGKLIANQYGHALLALSGLVIGAGLTILALAESIPVLVIAWIIIGGGMAMGLYDALFATLGALYGVQARSSWIFRLLRPDFRLNIFQASAQTIPPSIPAITHRIPSPSALGSVGR